METESTGLLDLASWMSLVHLALLPYSPFDCILQWLFCHCAACFTSTASLYIQIDGLTLLIFFLCACLLDPLSYSPILTSHIPAGTAFHGLESLASQASRVLTLACLAVFFLVFFFACFLWPLILRFRSFSRWTSAVLDPWSWPLCVPFPPFRSIHNSLPSVFPRRVLKPLQTSSSLSFLIFSVFLLTGV